MAKHETLSVYDYGTGISPNTRNKICDLYDSQNDLVGQAYEITVIKNWDGTYKLEFKIPYVVDQKNTGGTNAEARYGTGIFGRSRFGMVGSTVNRNFRWSFLKSDYLIRYTCGTKKIWFVANKPQKAKTGKTIYGLVSCDGFENLLKTRNIYKTFDDENGIGTIDYLMGQILAGTGWTYKDKEHGSDTMLEKDGTTEKIRTMNSDGKKGAIDLINTACSLFQARPIYDNDAMTVTVKAVNNRVQVLEGEVGRNLEALTVKHDSSNLATRVYIEGEYGDFGYVGIDDVIVDANYDPVPVDSEGEPTQEGTRWGLPFMLNFDYYREIGAFKQVHETALSTYLTAIRAKKAEISAKGIELTACEDSINTMIGYCKLAVYYKTKGYVTPMYTFGDITEGQAVLHTTDEVVLLKNDGEIEYIEWPSNPATVMTNAYGVAKFVTKAAGKIGAAEVQIEAKEKEISQLQRKINTLPETSPKIPEYRAEITRLESEIDTIFDGTEDTDGLHKMMQDVMKSNGLLYNLSQIESQIDTLNTQQDDIEATFIAAMGYMLRDGYWNNNNYAAGQERNMYLDAQDMVAEMGKPTTEYTFSYIRVSEDFDIQPDDIDINSIFKLYDAELQVDDKLFVRSVTYGVDDKKLGKIDVSNQDITLTGNDLGTLLSRMSQLADLIDQKNALYERAKAISNDGTLYIDRLNGQIDVIKNQILSSTSNWYTDESGNIVFLSADGGSAMMLSGAGFMLASGKDDNGEWNWRTLGTGRGITADEIVAGFISVDRLEAGSITTSKLSSEVGESLDLSSNVSVNARIESELAYKIEITATTEVLSESVKTTTLTATAYRGKYDITSTLNANRFNWKRKSNDTAGDETWNSTHKGMKSITVGCSDIQYSATYVCELMSEGET